MIRTLVFVLFTFTSASSVAQLCVQRLVAPIYPRLARVAQIQGKVTVEVTVASGGKIVVGKARGPKLLVENSKANLRHWILCPDATSQRSFTITYTYLLQGRQQYHGGSADVVFQLPQSVTITARPYEPQPSAEEPPGRPTVSQESTRAVDPQDGSVAAITDNLVPGRTQSYTNDTLSRVASAQTQATAGPTAGARRLATTATPTC